MVREPFLDHKRFSTNGNKALSPSLSNERGPRRDFLLLLSEIPKDFALLVDIPC